MKTLGFPLLLAFSLIASPAMAEVSCRHAYSPQKLVDKVLGFVSGEKFRSEYKSFVESNKVTRAEAAELAKRQPEDSLTLEQHLEILRTPELSLMSQDSLRQRVENFKKDRRQLILKNKINAKELVRLASRVSEKDSARDIEIQLEIVRSPEIQNVSPSVARRAVRRFQESQGGLKNIQEALDFEQIKASYSEASSEPFEALNSWIKTPEQAIYVYENLPAFGKRSREVLENLQAKNPNFIGTLKAKDSLLTFSFETNLTNPMVADFYQIKGISEVKWFEMKTEERLKLLADSYKEKWPIIPTSRKPPELADAPKREGAGFRVTNRNLEIQPKRISQQIEALHKLSETPARTTVDISFELPRSYDKFNRFTHWYKLASDVLFLRGLEEGIHGSRTRTISPIPNLLDYPILPSELPQNNLGPTMLSLGALGLEGHSYGAPINSRNVKIGLKLNNLSRDNTKLQSVVGLLSRSIRERVWEKMIDIRSLREMGLVFSLHPEHHNKLETNLSERVVEVLSLFDSFVNIGLIPYERFSYPQLRSKEMRVLTAEEVKHLQEARVRYEEALLAIGKNIRELRVNDPATYREKVREQIQKALTDWARDARVPDFFRDL